jgi:hypothetical protein
MYQLRIFCQFRYRDHRKNYQVCSFLPLFTILSLATMLITSQVATYADSACPSVRLQHMQTQHVLQSGCNICRLSMSFSQVVTYADSACPMTIARQLPQFKGWGRLIGNMQILNTYQNSIQII